MQFESQYKNHTLLTPSLQHVRFRKGHRVDDARFGTLDTKDGMTLRTIHGMTPKELEEFVMSQDEFKERVPGVKGIWLREERISREEAVVEDRGAESFLMNLSEATLREMLQKEGMPVPVTQDKKVLVAAVKAGVRGARAAAHVPLAGGRETAADEPEAGLPPAGDESSPAGDESAGKRAKKR